MSAKIRLLSDDVIGKIAAGEVVERPAAAIKEMVENSLDAGATAVTVEIRDGGISYFRVTDNGSGIAQSEIRMAFERHATSKITTANDLTAIQTLGFRGEALASIASVAHVTCTTRTKNDVSGIKVVNKGGRIESIEETACTEGTTFVVKDLFYNTPVRLKFLKKPTTEAGYVSDLMMRLILSRPDVSFRYVSQGKVLYHSAGDGKLASAIFSIYGKESRSMREVKGHQGGILLSGFVGVGDCARATRAHQSFFINGRYMKSAVLSSAIESACREHLMQGRYPSCVMHLTMPFEMVDVNVHPNKLECRFQDDASLFSAIEAIVKGLHHADLIAHAALVVFVMCLQFIGSLQSLLIQRMLDSVFDRNNDGLVHLVRNDHADLRLAESSFTHWYVLLTAYLAASSRSRCTVLILAMSFLTSAILPGFSSWLVAC